ncbi:hypothetical protein HanIR_Chr14g0710521 [Helianthus annuus]|nr:hypothetical protein HanIR_Chr14g0710521 [Helianthus annuus]
MYVLRNRTWYLLKIIMIKTQTCQVDLWFIIAGLMFWAVYDGLVYFIFVIIGPVVKWASYVLLIVYKVNKLLQVVYELVKIRGLYANLEGSRSSCEEVLDLSENFMAGHIKRLLVS